MRVHRLPVGQAPTPEQAFIQITKVIGFERYAVAVTRGLDTIVDGPFPSLNAADIGGQEIADAWGLTEVWVVAL